MTTHDHSERTLLSGFVTGRFLLVLLCTGVEAVAPLTWLGITLCQPSRVGLVTLGVGVLIIGFGVEYLLGDLIINGFDLAAPAWTVAAFSVSEALVLLSWLAIALNATSIGGFVLAATVLWVASVGQHTIEDNAPADRRPFARLLDPGTTGFSAVGVVGQTGWLLSVLHPLYVARRLPWMFDDIEPATVGLVVLALSLFVEHSVAVAYTRGG